MSNRVGIISDNSAAVIMTILRSWDRNKAVVLISGDAPIDVVRNTVRENHIDTCYCSSSALSKYRLSLPNVKVNDFCEKQNNWIYTEGLSKYLHPESDEIALILYSSGTTGRAKGIMLSHKAINKNADAIIQYMLPQKSDVFAIIKNLVHSSTIVGEVLVAIKCGCPIFFVPEHRNIRMLLEGIYKSKATIICMNPTLLALFMKLPLSTIVQKTQYLKKIYISGAILSNSLLKVAKERLSKCRVYNVYGMTECGPRIASQELSKSIDNCSVGNPIIGVQIRIMDENGKEVRNSNTIGHIEVNTPYRAKGYVNGYRLHIDDMGWINTGDVGYIDEERNLYIVGRSDNMLNVSGHNVYPESIEEVIRHVNGVEDCMVTGYKDEILGCILCCYYVGELAVKQDIYEQCKRYLLGYEIPKKFVCVETLQYSNGKIRRKQFEE